MVEAAACGAVETVAAIASQCAPFAGADGPLSGAAEDEVFRAFTLVLLQSGDGNAPFLPCAREEEILEALRQLADVMARRRRQKSRGKTSAEEAEE